MEFSEVLATIGRQNARTLCSRTRDRIEFRCVLFSRALAKATVELYSCSTKFVCHKADVKERFHLRAHCTAWLADDEVLHGVISDGSSFSLRFLSFF